MRSCGRRFVDDSRRQRELSELTYQRLGWFQQARASKQKVEKINVQEEMIISQQKTELQHG